MNLLEQLTAAAANAARLAEENTVAAARQAAKYRRADATKAAAGGQCVAKGLKQALLERLPIGEQDAILLAGVRALLSDLSFAESGLSATLTDLFSVGAIARTGVKRSYRYYRTH